MAPYNEWLRQPQLYSFILFGKSITNMIFERRVQAIPMFKEDMCGQSKKPSPTCIPSQLLFACTLYY